MGHYCKFTTAIINNANIILISGKNYEGCLEADYPKLGLDSSFAESEYNNAPDSKTLIIYPGIAHHGADLFASPVGDQFLKSLLDFVNAIL